MKRGSHEAGARSQRLVALCGAGILLFNFPLLTLWKGDVFGLPLLPLALFGIWVLLIVTLALLSDGRRPPAGPGRDGPPP